MSYPDTQLYIDGQWQDAADGRTLAVHNPATGVEIGRVAHAGIAELDRALAAAQKGFEIWRDMPPVERAKTMRRAAALMRERAAEIGALLTQEQGKPLAEAQGEAVASAEIIEWFADEGQRDLIYTIKADRIIDFSANYHMEDAKSGASLGTVKRKGMRSLWKASYEIHDEHHQPRYMVNEESAMTRFLDTLFSELPIIGLFAGYVFNPVYKITDTHGQVVARLKKQPAMFEGVFKLESPQRLSPAEQKRLMRGSFMVVILERVRG